MSEKGNLMTALVEPERVVCVLCLEPITLAEVEIGTRDGLDFCKWCAEGLTERDINEIRKQF